MEVTEPDEDEDKWKAMGAHASSSGPVSGAAAITLYRDGFTINDGPLRPLSDPLNKKFVDDIARGQCPEELKAGASDDVPVSVSDKRGEDYKAPEAAMTGAASSGRPAVAVPAKIENAIS